MQDDITDFLNESNGCINRLRGEWDTIMQIIAILQTTSGRVFICGNGGSASTASHFASDLIMQAHIRAVCLNDNIALTTAITNDIGWEYAYEAQLEGATKDDALIVISTCTGDGRSKNLIKAIEHMNMKGGATIGLGGRDGKCFNICEVNLVVKTDSTPIIESIHSLICHLIAFTI